jgi:hypothetical protein
MPNHTPVFVEQRVIAYVLGHAGEGPKRISAELTRQKWGELRSPPTASTGSFGAMVLRPPPSVWLTSQGPF